MSVELTHYADLSHLDPFICELSSPDLIPQCECKGALQASQSITVECVDHSQCQNNTCARICLSCRKRYCSVCFNDVHTHPLLGSCHSISYDTFVDIKAMYATYGTMSDNGIRALVLPDILRLYKTSLKLSPALTRALASLKARYTSTHYITLTEFLEAYTTESALLFNPAEASTVQRFQALNCFGRCLLRLSSPARSRKHHFIFGYLSHLVQISHGHHVYSVFNLARQLIYLNIFCAIIYVLMLLLPWLLEYHKSFDINQVDWAGLFAGNGLELLPIYYGAFPPYSGGANIMALWPICVTLIFICVIFFISFQVVNHNKSMTHNSALNASPAMTIFGLFEHNSTISKSSTLTAQRQYNTEIRISLARKYNPEKKRPLKEKWRYMWATVLGSVAFILAVHILLYYILTRYINTDKFKNREILGIDWTGFIIPLVFALCRLIMGWIIRAIVKFETPLRVGSFQNYRSNLFYRILINDMALIATIYTYLIAWRRQIPTLFINAVDAVDIFYYCNTPTTCLCPETKMGVELYRIIVVFFYVDVVWHVIEMIGYILRYIVCCGLCTSRKRKREAESMQFSSTLPTSEQIMPAPQDQHKPNIVEYYFSPVPRLNYILWIQLLIWSSIPFFPAAPILGIIIFVLSFIISFIKVAVFSTKPMMSAYVMPSRIMLAYVLTWILLVSNVPNIVMLSLESQCGPYISGLSESETSFSLFLQQANGFPVVIKEIFNYATNPVVLWLCLIAAAIYTVVMSTQSKITRKARKRMMVQLHQDTHDRNQVLASLGIDPTGEERQGHDLFVEWMIRASTLIVHTPDPYTTSTAHVARVDIVDPGMGDRGPSFFAHMAASFTGSQQPTTTQAMNTVGTKRTTPGLLATSDESAPASATTSKLTLYLHRIQRKQANFITLCRMSDQEVLALFTQCCPIPVAHILLGSLKQFRNELVIRRKQQI